MSCNRLFLIGVIALLFGIHFRVFDTFVLNEQASTFLQKRQEEKSASVASSDVALEPYDWWNNNAPAAPAPVALKKITPPNWLGWSLISVGTVLILTCPCFRS